MVGVILKIEPISQDLLANLDIYFREQNSCSNLKASHNIILLALLAWIACFYCTVPNKYT